MEELPFDDDGELTILSRGELEERIKERTDYLENVMDTMAELLMTVGKDGRIEMCNRAFLEVLGYEKDEIVGKPLDTVFSSGDVDQEFSDTRSKDEIIHGRVMDKMMREGRIKDMEVYFSSKDGDSIPMSVSASVMKNSDGSVDGFVFVAKDIRERKRREAKIRRQNERLDQFASIVSHDLRNPLSTAKMYLDFAKDSKDEDDFEVVGESLARMERMIDDLLTLARKGDVGETHELHLQELCSRAWRNIDVETEKPVLNVDADLVIEADEESILHIFENLFKNAIEHNEPGTNIRVGTLDDTDGFYVEDNGKGIPEEKREEVFEHGYTESEEGTGFGLSIVSRMIEAHGWDIEIKESEEGGARFEIMT